MDFCLFLLVNAALFIRPGELIPATRGWPIYNCIILASLLVAAPAVINQLTERSLVRSPITVCVLGVWAFIILSLLAQGDLEGAWNDGFEFAKVVAYYLLLVGVVNTPQRFVTLLGAVVVFTLTVNILAVLNFRGIIHLPTLEGAVSDNIRRMGGTGIFGDPNDLSMILVSCLIICTAGFFYRPMGLFRFTLAAPVVFFFYCLTLTQSRGGLMAFFAGCAVLGYGWLGAIRAVLVGAAGLPFLLMGLGGRQLNFGEAMTIGTGRARVELWSPGLEMLKESPLFGVGYAKYIEHVGQVAHNSFVHAFGELGFFGGIAFLGIFLIAGWSLWSLRAVRSEIFDPRLAYLLPFLMALVAAYCASMMSLSNGYGVPTYMVAGLAMCYDRLVRPGTSLPPLEFNGNLLKWLALSGVGFLLIVYLYIKVFYR